MKHHFAYCLRWFKGGSENNEIQFGDICWFVFFIRFIHISGAKSYRTVSSALHEQKGSHKHAHHSGQHWAMYYWTRYGYLVLSDRCLLLIKPGTPIHVLNNSLKLFIFQLFYCCFLTMSIWGRKEFLSIYVYVIWMYFYKYMGLYVYACVLYSYLASCVHACFHLIWM